mmetsp:Transcript_53320/g.172059  ORF Transcript_53320/g.172059 Transcript_53320/m.172059 type:complete len:141 (+) Transcript_53320:518-940(+)
MAQHRMTARSCEVDYDCVLASIKALGLSAKKSEVRAAMRELGACPETGALDFDMFSELMQRVYASRDPLDAMLASFRLFDPAGHGRINIKDLRRIVADLGLEDHLPEEDLDRMVQFFDRNGDGEVDEEDFLRMLSGTSFQ